MGQPPSLAHDQHRHTHGAQHALRRRIGRTQLRIRALEPLQLAKQAVVFSVRHAGRIENVIRMIVVGDLRAQRLHTLLRLQH